MNQNTNHQYINTYSLSPVLKFLPFYTFLLLVSASLYGQSESLFQPKEEVEEYAYDSLLAKETGADDYGMKTYVMAFLKTGPNRSSDKEAAAALQRAHLDNIKKMAEMGKLFMAGPFLDNQEIRGIYIFDVATIEEARALTATDPAIQAGSLIMELHPWYGPASLGEIRSLQKKVTKISF